MTNNGAASTEITGVALAPVIPDFDVLPPSVPFDLLAGDTKEIDVTFTASAEGVVSTQLVITPKPGSGCIEQSVTLTGCGIEPRIQAPATCLKWDDVQLPPEGITEENRDLWTSVKNIRLRNSGTAPLNIMSVQIPGQVAGQEEFLIEAPEGTSVLIPPGADWSFGVRYSPKNIGSDSANVQICSDAANPGSSTFTCGGGFKATSICLSGSTIDPRLTVLPETLIFRNVLVGETKILPIRINNKAGRGAVFIKSISLENGNSQIFIPTDTNGQPLITHALGTGTPSPVTLPFPAGGYRLEDTDELIVAIEYKPTAPPMAMRAQLQIEHSDVDAARLGASPGSSYPKWTVDIFGTSETNTSPVAIAQSPPESLGDRAGTRQLTVMLGAEISIGATNSYDNDDDPETPAAEDYIKAYSWTIANGDAAGLRFTGPGDQPNHSTAQTTSVRFDVSGTYTLQLNVQDSRNVWSETNTSDSKLVVTVIELPTAILRQCVTQNTSVTTKNGVDICFDGCNSSAVAGGGLVTDYRWDVQKEGAQAINFSNGNCSAHYTFAVAGRYTVKLRVKDENENWSKPATLPVTVFYDQALRVEMNWSGGGDVDLHYIRPGGVYEDTSDCNPANHAPNWVRFGYGNPELTPSGDGGLSPEVLTHNNPGDSPSGQGYTLTINYKTPSQACGYENHYVKDGYREDCEHCGCNTSNLGCTLLFGCAVKWGSCCKTCDINDNIYVCHPNPAVVNVRIYAGGALTPTCTKPGIILADANSRISYTLIRKNGEWICP